MSKAEALQGRTLSGTRHRSQRCSLTRLESGGARGKTLPQSSHAISSSPPSMCCGCRSHTRTGDVGGAENHLWFPDLTFEPIRFPRTLHPPFEVQSLIECNDSFARQPAQSPASSAEVLTSSNSRMSARRVHHDHSPPSLEIHHCFACTPSLPPCPYRCFCLIWPHATGRRTLCQMVERLLPMTFLMTWTKHQFSPMTYL
jgi:hypothetical protein